MKEFKKIGKERNRLDQNFNYAALRLLCISILANRVNQ